MASIAFDTLRASQAVEERVMILGAPNLKSSPNEVIQFYVYADRATKPSEFEVRQLVEKFVDSLQTVPGVAVVKSTDDME